MQNLSRRKISGGTAATEEVAIIRGLIKEAELWGDKSREASDREDDLEDEIQEKYYKMLDRVDTYPAKTIAGLAEKAKFMLPEDDGPRLSRLIRDNICRIAEANA